MKKKTWNLIKNVLRYLIPLILGWIEGDSHAVADGILSICNLFI